MEKIPNGKNLFPRLILLRVDHRNRRRFNLQSKHSHPPKGVYPTESEDHSSESCAFVRFLETQTNRSDTLHIFAHQENSSRRFSHTCRCTCKVSYREHHYRVSGRFGKRWLLSSPSLLSTHNRSRKSRPKPLLAPSVGFVCMHAAVELFGFVCRPRLPPNQTKPYVQYTYVRDCQRGSLLLLFIFDISR